MTEAEWRTCSDPQAMLDFLQGKASERQLRLFACACCRRIWHLLTDPRCRRAVEVAERYADGLASRAELVGAFGGAADAFEDYAAGDPPRAPAIADVSQGETAAAAAEDAASSEIEIVPRAAEEAAAAIGSAVWNVFPPGHARPEENEVADAARRAERAAQCDLLRDIFGNPFRPVKVDPACRTTEVVGLARAIHHERDFRRTRELRDLLVKAGCNDENLLQHLARSGECVRGCWVLDALLGQH